ncbi:hypothetical protein BJV77DRAFT_1023211, partial [Russula vinacea]
YNDFCVWSIRSFLSYILSSPIILTITASTFAHPTTSTSIGPRLPMSSAEPPGMTDDTDNAMLIPEELALKQNSRNTHASARYVSTTTSPTYICGVEGSM